MMTPIHQANGQHCGTPHGGCAQVQAGPCQDLRDLHSAQHGAENLQLLDEVANVVGELVDRLRDLDQGSGPLFIDAAQPRADGVGGDQEPSGRLLQIPGACGLHLEDGHPLGRRVVRASMGRKLRHPHIFDADLLPQEADLLMGSIQLRFQPDPGVGAVGRPASGVGQRELGQTHHVQDGRFDPGRPTTG